MDMKSQRRLRGWCSVELGKCVPNCLTRVLRDRSLFGSITLVDGVSLTSS